MTGELPRIPDALAQSPATDKVVFQYLYDAETPLSQDAIASKTRTPKRTVRDVLGRLEADGLVESWEVPGDARTKVYELNPGRF